jgi:hypothetical protein
MQTKALNVEHILTPDSGFSQGVIPDGCNSLAKGIVLSRAGNVAYWVSRAWAPQGPGYTVDYGQMEIPLRQLRAAVLQIIEGPFVVGIDITFHCEAVADVLSGKVGRFFCDIDFKTREHERCRDIGFYKSKYDLDRERSSWLPENSGDRCSLFTRPRVQHLSFARQVSSDAPFCYWLAAGCLARAMRR